MSDTNTGGPAFPSHGSMGEVAHEGMTLRDYFAAKAMAHMSLPTRGFTGNNSWRIEEIDGSILEGLSAVAYRWADAMLKARNA
jgi:hypothetical protein